MNKKIDWLKVGFDLHRVYLELKETLPGLTVHIGLRDYGYGAKYDVSIMNEAQKIHVHESDEDLPKAVKKVQATFKLAMQAARRSPAKTPRIVQVIDVADAPALRQPSFPQLKSGGAA